MAKGSDESCAAGGAPRWGWWFCLLPDPDWLLLRLSHDVDDDKDDGFCDLYLCSSSSSSSCCRCWCWPLPSWINCLGLDIGVKNCSVGGSSTNLVNVITTLTVGTTGIATCPTQNKSHKLS